MIMLEVTVLHAREHLEELPHCRLADALHAPGLSQACRDCNNVTHDRVYTPFGREGQPGKTADIRNTLGRASTPPEHGASAISAAS